MNFVVLSSQRSGSSFFCRCLDSHPNLDCRQELLRQESDRSPAVLELLYSDKQNFGFNIQYDQLTDACWKWLKAHVSIIQLIRRNILETVLWWPSHFEEGDKGLIWGGGGPPLVVDTDSLTVIPEKVVAKVDELNKQIDYYAPYTNFHVFYEDDLTAGSDTTEFVNTDTRKSMLDWFGVHDRKLYDAEKNQRKNRRGATISLVRNYDELMKALEGKRLWYEG